MKKAILVVSFGTTYDDARDNSIGKIYNTVKREFSDYYVYQCFTSQMVINSLKKRDILVPNIGEALDKLLQMNIKEVYILPTHMIGGIEYKKILARADAYSRVFEKLVIAKPILTEENDCDKVAAVLIDILKASKSQKYILMGHGSSDDANIMYSRMNNTFLQLGYDNIRIALVEAKPDIWDALENLKGYGGEVILHPFMVVAGDHANNDMASEEEDSYVTILKRQGYRSYPIVRGLGEYEGFVSLYIDRIKEVLD